MVCDWCMYLRWNIRRYEIVCVWVCFLTTSCGRVFLHECSLFACYFFSTFLQLIDLIECRYKTLLHVWSHHSDRVWSFSFQINQHDVCLRKISQGWWSYVRYPTARPHLAHDTVSVSCSLSLLHSSLASFLQAAADILSAPHWVILSQSVISPSSPQIFTTTLFVVINQSIAPKNGGGTWKPMLHLCTYNA